MILKSLVLLLIVHKLSVAKAEGDSGGCGPPPAVPHAIPIEGQSFPKKTQLRYKCESGFVRKAGTSSLITCVNTEWVFALQLICIPDPRLPPATPKPQLFYNEKAVVSGSVVGLALCALMFVVLFFLYTKGMLPFRRRPRSSPEIGDQQETLPMATAQSNSGNA